jgi:hypothetical protein
MKCEKTILPLLKWGPQASFPTPVKVCPSVSVCPHPRHLVPIATVNHDTSLMISKREIRGTECSDLVSASQAVTAARMPACRRPAVLQRRGRWCPCLLLPYAGRGGTRSWRAPSGRACSPATPASRGGGKSAWVDAGQQRGLGWPRARSSRVVPTWGGGGVSDFGCGRNRCWQG